VSKSTGIGLDSVAGRDETAVAMAGTRSPPSMGDPDRRLAAVWFCDVVGSTKIAAELGDRPFRLLIARFLAVARSAIHRSRGREVDTAGDGMFAIFDAPAAALRAASETALAVRDLGLEIRSGVHLGEVEQDADGRVGGIAVHVGARVASLANAGEILTTATTGELASGSGFRFEERGSHILKGIAGPHGIVAVIEVDGEPLPMALETVEARRRRGASAADATATRLSGAAVTSDASHEEPRRFVGRVRELDELTSALRDAVSGHGSLLLISGEPGIGKSRLMEEVAGHAKDLGWRVLTGRCWEGGGAPAYWPWIQVVRAAGGEFERFAPIPGTSDTSHGKRASVVSEPIDPEAARFRLFDEVGRFLTDAARDRPCLIVLDDLHAADEPSLLLLRFLATSLPERTFVAVVSYREGEPAFHEQAELFADLTRLGRRIPLRGLTADEVALYIELASGDAPSDAVVTRVSDVTGGNPFFIGEVVRALVAEGLLTSSGPAAVRLPEEVRALIRRRVAGLSPEAVRLLRIASVVGRNFDVRVIAPPTTLSANRIVNVLDEAEQAGVIAKDRDLPGTYMFAHDLVRATMYEDLAASRRMELHRTVGNVLESLFRDDLDPHLAEIAHHLVQAAPLGEAERAVEYSIKAGDRAAAVLAYEDAARLYSRALKLPSPTETMSGRQADILLRLGDVQSRSGDTENAGRSFEEAAEIARRVGAPDTIAHAALGYVTQANPARLGFGGLLLTARFQGGATGIALLEEALEALPEGDNSLRARVLARLATELYTTDLRDRRVALSDEAVEMALRLGDPQALVAALHGRHWATLEPDSVHDRLANAQQMLLVATGAGDEESAFLARHARLHCFLELCDIADLDAELEAMARLAGRIRQPFYLWHTASLRGMRSILEGRLDDAERQFRDAREIARLRDSEYVAYHFEFAQMVAVRWAQGRLEEVKEQIDEHGERFRGIPRWRDALAAAEFEDERSARAELERHARNDFSELPRDGLWILHMCALAEAAVLLKDRRRGASAYDLLKPFAERNAISISTFPFGPVAMRLGMLATLLERWKEAEEHYDHALERCRAMGARAIEARVLIEHAKMVLARSDVGDEERANSLVARTMAICEELELPAIGDRAARLQAHGPRSSGEDAIGRATFRREGQIWTVAYENEMARLRDLKGLRYIHLLLAAPGRDIHVVELTGLLAREPSAGRHRDEELHPSRLDAAEAMLDPQAKNAYRKRLAELADELEEARSWNDPERVARLEEEIDAITAELEGALGLGGRNRDMPSPAERARVSVTKAVKVAIRVVSAECPLLGEHLANSLRTGRFCSYAPPGHEPPTWNL
jgi:class 3 adenylate cyclase